MARLIDLNARRGDESQAAQRLNRPIRLWAALIAVVIIGVIAALSIAATGPGANTGRVAADTSRVEGGVAPGVGSSFAGQPGGRPDGKPSPNPNAPKEDATR